MDSGGRDAALPSDPEALKAENKRLAVQFKAQHGLIIAFFLLVFILHASGIYLFCTGFLLSRLVLDHRSECASPPVEVEHYKDVGNAETGCWHRKSFDKAIIIIIDALRYDFTVPFHNTTSNPTAHQFHDALSFLYETSSREPSNAFLRPFIADPPTTTESRLKGLTTGTLPTFIDAGSNFGGSVIDEDNVVEQLHKAGKRVVQLGDDTWQSLFADYFEPNLTKPFDSFNVWDLHTVDNGVSEHLFPLLQPDMAGSWDVIFAHYLGVDHAGHRYGPNHPAMADKLRQMDQVLRDVVAALDDTTLLVVMGDHGMDVKGDHGGESDDEVEAALWMYTKARRFGRSTEGIQVPLTAKSRPLNQVDIVPTLALLLGIPVPFNNLGKPIEEAFIGNRNNDYRNLAEVTRITAAQIQKYQQEYFKARNIQEDPLANPPLLWEKAQSLHSQVKDNRDVSAPAWQSTYILS